MGTSRPRESKKDAKEDGLESLVARRVQFLTDYQNEAYAKRYADFVARVAGAERAIGATGGPPGGVDRTLEGGVPTQQRCPGGVERQAGGTVAGAHGQQAEPAPRDVGGDRVVPEADVLVEDAAAHRVIAHSHMHAVTRLHHSLQGAQHRQTDQCLPPQGLAIVHEAQRPGHTSRLQGVRHHLALPARANHKAGDLFLRLEAAEGRGESPARSLLKRFAAAWAA